MQAQRQDAAHCAMARFELKVTGQEVANVLESGWLTLSFMAKMSSVVYILQAWQRVCRGVKATRLAVGSSATSDFNMKNVGSAARDQCAIMWGTAQLLKTAELC